MPGPVAESYESNAGTASSLTINAPAGLASGNLLLASITTNGNPTVTLPSGWTQLEQIAGTPTTTVYYLVAGGSEPSSYTWSFSASIEAAGGIVRISNVDSGSPINAHNNTFDDGSTTPSSNSITTSADNCLIVQFLGIDRDESPYGAPSGYTQMWAATIGGLASNVSAWKLQASAGATGSATWSKNGSRFSELFAVAVAPGTGGGGGKPWLYYAQMMGG